MNYKRAGAMVFVAIMVAVPFAAMVRAAEEPALPIPITPADSAPAYGVFFADNMAFTPQWRIGNLVRIEVAVFKAFDVTSDGLVDASSIPVAVNTDMTTGVVYEQADLTADPNLILNTWMVSVPEIRITISSATTDDIVVFYSNFLDETGVDTVGREINKAGHLIYGLQWDTTLVDAGVYKVSVEIPGGYVVAFPLRHLLTEESADPIGYEILPADVDGSSGQGGLELPNNGYIYLGKLITKGGGGGKGGRR